jgi:hypothetical protein
VGTPHKSALRAIEVVSALPADQLVAICKDAADQCKIRLEAENSGQLVFSIRGLVRPEKNRLMIFEVRLSGNGDQQVMRSRIKSYRTSQAKYLGLIPMEPRKLVGLSVYDKFIERLGELVRSADSSARVTVTDLEARAT